MPSDYLSEILFARGPLHPADEIILVRSLSDTGVSQAFLLGGQSASLHILNGATANLTIQANNMSTENASFSANWFTLTTVTGNVTYLSSDNPVRYIRCKNTGTLTASFQCVVFSSAMGPSVD